ncbi:MAG: hypothetical protein M9928_18690 [Anaerolineae bacterium]|nr:hypothetical protein [Anaerolineae bacterium]MCO5207042.1 hypothetical protein [Anaerolineae bacterium]
MSKNKTPEPPEDLQQIRNLLFGEQATQYDDRFLAVENAINALRRENRALRNALEVEATARTEHDHTQNERLIAERDAALTDLTDVLQAYLKEEQAQRAARLEALTKTLDAFLQHLDDQTAAAIGRMQAEQTERAAQFKALKATLLAAHTGDDEVADSLKSMLDGFRSGHITSLDIVSENGQG